MKKCRLSTGMDGRLSAVICAEKRGLNLARFLPSLTTQSTLLVNSQFYISLYHDVGCCEGNEPHQSIDSISHSRLLSGYGKCPSYRFHAALIVCQHFALDFDLPAFNQF